MAASKCLSGRGAKAVDYPLETHKVTLHENVWRMIRECAGSRLYGEGLDQVMLALLRPGLEQAAQAGFCKLRKKR